MVYGRVAGATATSYLTKKLSAARRLGSVAGHVSGFPVTISVGGLDISIAAAGAPPAPPRSLSSPATEAPAKEEAKKVEKKAGVKLDMAEVAKHNTESDCWVVVNGEVLDATPFLADHPGGILCQTK